MTPPKSSGRFVWHELVTTDTAAALAFYSELFGWSHAAMDMGPMGTYTILKSQGVDVGGLTPPPPGKDVPPSWLAYCSVPDVDAAAAKATRLGGKVMAPPMDIPNVGRFAVLIDPQGGALAPFCQAEERPEPAGPPAVGTFCWNELLTSDPRAAIGFYGEVYGWSHVDRDMGPMGTYHVLKRGERDAGGILKAPMPGQPTAWLSYVAVADVDEAAKRAQGLKGKLIVPPADIPKIGRFAVVADPHGATLALFKGSM